MLESRITPFLQNFYNLFYYYFFFSYTVSVGIVDKLTRYCKSVRDPIDDNQPAAQFLLSTLELLTTLTVR